MGFKFFPAAVLRNLKMETKFRLMKLSTNVNNTQVNEVISEYDEVQIQVPWGHIAGKWYGPKNIRPVVGVHGWQDNCGTFDRLAPLLPQHVGFLSLDLPGHGLSSRLPNGIYYNVMDYLHVLRIVMKEYNWDKISIIGHSMSAIIGFLFAAIFPSQIDMLIALDSLKPQVSALNKLPESIASRMENFIIADERNRDKVEPPSYTYDTLVEKLHVGTFYSIDKDKCHYLLERSVQKSAKYPDQYFFTRDSRLKSYNYYIGSQDLNIEFAKRIKCPHLFIKATDSPYFEEKEYFYETLQVLRKNPRFEFHEVKGTHHVHLNNADRVSEIIKPFILKCRPLKSVCKL